MSIHMVRRPAIQAGTDRIKPETFAVLESTDYERVEAGTSRRFVSARFDYMEGHINELALFAQGKKKPAFEMSLEGIRAIEEAVAQVLQFTPVPRHEKVRDPRRGTRVIRRTDIIDCKLPKCTCNGGYEHYELPVDAILEGIREAFHGIVTATEAEDAHINACIADGLGCTLACHGINAYPRKLWDQVKPPTTYRITQDEFARYHAWNAKWRITAHHLDGTVDATYDYYHLFDRAKNLAVEEAAREAPRPIVPPDDWVADD